MNKYRITFAKTLFGGDKKIDDIRDFRTLTRNPFTDVCSGLTFAKTFIERIYEGNPVELEVTPEEAAFMLTKWLDADLDPNGWRITGAKPVVVECSNIVQYTTN